MTDIEKIILDNQNRIETKIDKALDNITLCITKKECTDKRKECNRKTLSIKQIGAIATGIVLIIGALFEGLKSLV